MRLARVLGHGVGSWKLLLGPPHFGLEIMRAEGLWGNHVPVTLRCRARGVGVEASSRPNQPCNPISLPGEIGKHLVPPALQLARHTLRHSCQGAMMNKQRPLQTIQMANGQSLSSPSGPLWLCFCGSVLGLLSCFSQSTALELS